MSETGYSCCGGSCCGGSPEKQGVNRRDFIKTAAAAVGGVGIASAFSDPEAARAELDSWNLSLLEQGQRRVYTGDELRHIAMPLGGIGAGQVYLRGDGTLNPWQIVNNFNFGAKTTGAMFAVRTDSATARLLQVDAIGSAAGVKSIDFAGEYPFAWLDYGDDTLPVAVSLETFTPFIPLNPQDSGMPLVYFRFTVRNTGASPVSAHLLASVPNLVGWDGYAALKGVEHEEFGQNTNTVEQRGAVTMLRLGSKPGDGHRIERATRFVTNSENAAFHMRHCTNMKVLSGRPVRLLDDRGLDDVYFVEDYGGSLAPSELDALLNHVEAGAALIITNGLGSLLDELVRKKSKDNAEVFEDFESGSYAQWTIDGDCFGISPATGTLSNQQTVSGWELQHYLNSYAAGDDKVGTATSRPFTLSKRYIHLLVGGGNNPGETCVNLRVDGEVVATATGENTEKLRRVLWDVSGHRGKQAVIEIVDSHRGGWGHVLVDHIVFSDTGQAEPMPDAIARRYRDALPFKFRSLREVRKPALLKPGSPIMQGVSFVALEAKDIRILRWFRKKRGAHVLLSTKDGTELVVAGKYGKGTIVVCNGRPQQWVTGLERKAVIGNLVAHATGNPYTPPNGLAPASPLAGEMALAVLEPEIKVSACPQWDDIDLLWKAFCERGELSAGDVQPSILGRTWNGALSAELPLRPNEEKSVTFALAWHFPNRTRDSSYGWGPPRMQYDHRLGNQYNNRFKDVAETIDYAAANRDRLHADTALYHTTLYNSTLPRYYVDAVSANASILHSPIYVWLEDGTVGGFEGADRCCPMNCTHVYNYAMSTAFLQPGLERNVRETDLLVQMHPDEHYIPHRTVLPLSLPRLGKQIGGPEHPALDGELGTILKTYREWRQCGDREWLGRVWVRARTLMRYIMKEHDPEGAGVIKGEQPNTYDTHLYGSNTFIGTLYLGALRAAQEMALVMGDVDAAAEFRARFEKGQAGYDATCWNGEYYYNAFDAPGVDEKLYNSGNCYGPGCHSDQLLGQWWAHALGLGYVLPKDHVLQALRSMHGYNWRVDLSNHQHTQRVFAEGREKGLLCCSWPHGGRPQHPILYCDEVWTGLEYHVAATMIWEGMVHEGLQVVRGARDRYTGNQRNPWSEIECGQHYARAMSSYSLLLASAGLDYDAGARRIAFAPRITPENYKGFFVGAGGWGSLSQRRDREGQQNAVDIRYGAVDLATLIVELPKGVSNPRVALMSARKPIRFSAKTRGNRCTIELRDTLTLKPGVDATVHVSWT